MHYRHDALIATGTVVEIESVDSTLRVGQGPAIFTPAMLAFKPVTGERSYLLYRIKQADGTIFDFRSEEHFELGACVQAWTETSKVRDSYWRLGEVLLKPSSGCDKP